MKLLSSLLAFILFSFVHSNAQTPWQLVEGLYGNSSQVAFACDSNGVVFATYSQRPDWCYRSANEGEHWEKVDFGVDAQYVNGITVLPNGDIYALLIPRSLMKSTDGGETWTRIGLDNDEAFDITSSVTGDLILYDYYHIHVSTDGGESWKSDTILDTLGQPVSIVDLEINDKGIVYVVLESEEIYRGSLGSWTSIAVPNNSYMSDIEVMPSGRIYLSAIQGVYFTDDNGLHWEEEAAGLPANMAGARLYAKDDKLYIYNYDGTFTRPDPQFAWETVTLGLGNVATEGLMLAGNGALYIASGRIFVTPDNGGVWYDRTHGILAPTVMNVIAQGSDTLYASDYNTTYASSNRGQEWTPLQQIGELESYVIFVKDPYSNTLYSSAMGVRNLKRNLGRSIDGGATWQIKKEFKYNYVQAMTFSVSGDIYAASGDGIFVSTNGGDSWSMLPKSEDMTSVNSLASDSEGNAYIVVFEQLTTSMVMKMFKKSTQTWSTLEGTPVDAIDRFKLAVDQNTNWIYLTKRNDLYVSKDKGQSWSKLSTISSSGTVLGFQLLPGTLCAYGTQGISMSVDGSAWTVDSLGMGLASVKSVTLASDGTLYAGTDAGLYKRQLVTSVEANDAVAQLTVCPNPVDDRATIEIGEAEHSMVDVFLYDMSGICLERRSTMVLSGRVILETSALQVGVYQCRIASGERAYNARIVKN